MSDPARFARLTLFTVMMAAFPQLGVAQTSGCEPSTTSPTARGLLHFARYSVSDTLPTSFRVRTAVGLPLIDTGKVVLTRDSKRCADAVKGINTKQGTPGQVRRIHLVKLNTDGYMAVEPVSAPGVRVRPVYLLTRQMAVSNILYGM